MNQPTASIQTLHNQRQSWLEQFAVAGTISETDVEHCSAIELYAVVSEHWLKCTPSAKEFLMSHRNVAISRHACMMSNCFLEGPEFAVA